MAAKKACLPTIWEIPDDLWVKIEAILQAQYPPKPVGRPRADLRKCVEGIVFVLRSNCPWNRLPRRYGDDSTVHRWFQRWCRDGIFAQMWALLVAEWDALGEVDWGRQAADSSLGKARFGGQVGPNPTDRGKNGTKKTVLGDGQGGP